MNIATRLRAGISAHPRGLVALFNLEMWERFSFYGMLGILPFYLYHETSQGGLGMSETTAASIVGAYGGLVYLSSVGGAWIADRLLGPERTLFLSASLIMCGHISLALQRNAAGVAVGLVCVALGAGGVKSNATTLVGALYGGEDSRRDAGFALYYMGISIGGFAGPLLTGEVQTDLGFHYAFGVAAICMALGLGCYVASRKIIRRAGSTITRRPIVGAQYPLLISGLAIAVISVVSLFAFEIVHSANLSDAVAIVSAGAAVALFTVILSDRRLTRDERSRVSSFIPLFLGSVVFWSMLQQEFTVVLIYAAKQTNRSILGWEMPVAWTTSIEPAFTCLLAGAFAATWIRLRRRPSTPIRFALGIGVLGVAFLMFLPLGASAGNSMPLVALAGILLLFSISLLLLYPAGMSVASLLAPVGFQTRMVALYFLSLAIGTALSGHLAKYYSESHQSAYFGVTGGVGVLVAIGLATCSPAIRRLMKGVH